MRVSLVGKISRAPSEGPGQSSVEFPLNSQGIHLPPELEMMFSFLGNSPQCSQSEQELNSPLFPHISNQLNFFGLCRVLKSSQMMQQWTWCSCRAVGFKPRQHHPKNSFSPLVLLSCQNSVKTPFNLHKKMVFTLKSWLLGCWDARSEHPCLLLFCFNF